MALNFTLRAHHKITYQNEKEGPKMPPFLVDCQPSLTHPSTSTVWPPASTSDGILGPQLQRDRLGIGGVAPHDAVFHQRYPDHPVGPCTCYREAFAPPRSRRRTACTARSAGSCSARALRSHIPTHALTRAKVPALWLAAQHQGPTHLFLHPSSVSRPQHRPP